MAGVFDVYMPLSGSGVLDICMPLTVRCVGYLYLIVWQVCWISISHCMAGVFYICMPLTVRCVGYLYLIVWQVCLISMYHCLAGVLDIYVPLYGRWVVSTTGAVLIHSRAEPVTCWVTVLMAMCVPAHRQPQTPLLLIR